jgi:putative proteasome-type protease
MFSPRFVLVSRDEALISIGSTMRSNVTVGPPIDLLVYTRDELRSRRHRRFLEKDPDPLAVH